jgi:hypothetical protein
MIDERKIPSKVRALGLGYQAVYILVMEEGGQSSYEIFENSRRNGLLLEIKDVSTMLIQLKAYRILRSVRLLTLRDDCLEVA